MKPLFFALAIAAGFFAGSFVSAIRYEHQITAYQLQAQQRYTEALKNAQKKEQQMEKQLQRIMQANAADLSNINNRYNELLGRLRTTESSRNNQCLPNAAGSAPATGSGQKNQLSGPGIRLHQDTTALEKAKRYILWQAKELDICGTHYNTLRKLYNAQRN